MKENDSNDMVKTAEMSELQMPGDNTVVKFDDFVSPQELYDELLMRVRKYHPSADISMIEKAYQIASEAHADQRRKSGEPYIIHPLHVAIILADLEMDKETIVAGLLHDVVEDTVMTDEQITQEFGPEVALLVDGVTKLGQLSYDADKVEVQAENLRKMFLAMAKDIRVIIIKLADRLHNMRTLKYMRPEKQKEKARETMDIYAPLADRLGIAKIKTELDDLSLKYLEPEAYYDLVEKVAQRKSEREEHIQALVLEIRKIMEEAGIKAEVTGRAKHFFSIYKKMRNQNKTLDQIYDLFAIRIIVEDVKDCYAALGVIHENYTPIPGRFKDYIAMPKPNMYQSLHTTLIGPGGRPFEIQIRTKEMHRTSEFGIAAHWKYKEANYGDGRVDVAEEEKLSWLRQILEWQQGTSDNREFMSLLKTDLNLFSDTVFCFTPQGDVKSLPAGSITIDFAYAIHSAVGNKMVGAKVNGKLVPIDYVITNGDIVEILTSANSKGPSRDWLAIVKSPQAKSKINQWFRNEFKEENIQNGRDMLIRYCRTKAIDFNEINKPEYQDKVQKKYGFRDWDSVLAAVGHGGLKEAQIINRMLEEQKHDEDRKLTDSQVLAGVNDPAAQERTKKRAKRSGIVVKGMGDVAVHLSKCCGPVPGDEIVGFITRGRGVSVHRTDCMNILQLPDFDRSRLIEVEWQNGAADEELGNGGYLAELKIFADDRTGLLADIAMLLKERGLGIASMHTHTSKKGMATILVSFYIKGKDELADITQKLRQISDVVDIQRTTA